MEHVIEKKVLKMVLKLIKKDLVQIKIKEL